MASKDIKPGELAKVSAVYDSPSGSHMVLDRGEKAPPTSKPGEVWHPRPGTITNPGKKR